MALNIYIYQYYNRSYHVAGMSDVSSATPTPQSALSADVQMSIRTLNTRAKELKAELRTLRRLQLANAECMKETLHATFHKIKVCLVIFFSYFKAYYHMIRHAEESQKQLAFMGKSFVNSNNNKNKFHKPISGQWLKINQGKESKFHWNVLCCCALPLNQNLFAHNQYPTLVTV